ncbi:MAG TPA: citrate/2-methylcitrate synthase [Chloroflexota bacterium]|nr:citrate/2-methylcitrate synthase [Chloroflexota bacterium]
MAVSAGLADVVAGPTAICDVNGQLGQLFYRGYDIRDLARESSFEEVVWLLWRGELPSASELATFRAELAAQRRLPDQVALMVDRLAAMNATPMPMLRVATTLLQVEDPNADKVAEGAERQASVHLVARFPTILARYQRRHQGLEPVEPSPNADQATAYLTMLHGTPPDELDRQALDILLILLADHEFNASTFTARVIAATLANVYSAIDGAIAALSGPLHGGANEQVMHMLEQIGSASHARSYVENLLAQKKRVMGFGHRVYRSEDPRAGILRQIARELGERKQDTHWFDIATQVEETVWNAKHLYPNVDFYSAPIMHQLGIPTDLFTPTFAVSRVAGWTAHVLEQHANNRLIRPRGDYIGPAPRPYVPLSAR